MMALKMVIDLCQDMFVQICIDHYDDEERRFRSTVKSISNSTLRTFAKAGISATEVVMYLDGYLPKTLQQPDRYREFILDTINIHSLDWLVKGCWMIYRGVCFVSLGFVAAPPEHILWTVHEEEFHFRCLENLGNTAVLPSI